MSLEWLLYELRVLLNFFTFWPPFHGRTANGVQLCTVPHDLFNILDCKDDWMHYLFIKNCNGLVSRTVEKYRIILLNSRPRRFFDKADYPQMTLSRRVKLHLLTVKLVVA